MFHPKIALVSLATLAAIGCAKKTDVNTTFEPGGLITQISQSASSVCVGASLPVTVEAAHPDDPLLEVEVWIDGTPGRVHQLPVFESPGTNREIRVYAKAEDGTEDSRTVSVEVMDCPGSSFATLLVSPNPYHRYQVDFRLVGATGSVEWAFGDGATETTDGPFVTHDFSAEIDHNVHYTRFNAGAVGGGLAAVRTHYVESIYQNALRQGFVQTDVNCGLLKTDGGGGDPGGGGTVNGGTPGVGIPSISVPVATPGVQEAGVNRNLTVQNPHSKAVTFDRFVKVMKSCDPEVAPQYSDVDPLQVFGAPAAASLAAFGLPIPVSGSDTPLTGSGVPTKSKQPLSGPLPTLTVSSGGTLAGDWVIDPSNISPDTCVIGVHLIGWTDEETPKRAYGHCYAKVRQSPHRISVVEDDVTRTVLGALMEAKGIDVLDTDALHKQEALGEIQRTIGGWSGGEG